MPAINLFIPEFILNAALSQIALSGSEHKEGPHLPVVGPAWSVTLDWRVDGFSVQFLDGSIKYRARLHGEAKGFSYTDEIEGAMTAQFEDNTLLIQMQSLMATLYVSLAGVRINIRDIDIANLVPEEARNLRIEVLRQQIRIPLPCDSQVLLAVQDPTIIIAPGVIRFTADLHAGIE